MYRTKEALEAAESRPKGNVAYRRKDGMWVYITSSAAQQASKGSRKCQQRDAYLQAEYARLMAEKRAKNPIEEVVDHDDDDGGGDDYDGSNTSLMTAFETRDLPDGTPCCRREMTGPTDGTWAVSDR